MIRITQLKLKIDHSEEELVAAIREKAHGQMPLRWQIVKRSVDARKKPVLYYIYTIDVSFPNEKRVLHYKNSRWTVVKKSSYHFPYRNRRQLQKHERPVIIGMGPAGLFAGLVLARNGFAPVIFERGDAVEERTEKVERFFREGMLDEESNVQFGEGGAGTFSDGKLNTLVKDKMGRNRFVLEEFVRHGAPEEILYEAKPHIGTDVLKNVVASMREEILEQGGSVYFGTKVVEVLTAETADPVTDAANNRNAGQLRKVIGLRLESRKGRQMKKLEWPCKSVILAIGHSARDTFSMLYEKKTYLTPKAFAIGLRVEHPARMINESQYGEDYPDNILSAASYKLAHSCENGRNVYSFCMCPGGYVVNSSSEQGRLCVNGMSNHRRDADNSNSAIITTVMPEDFGSTHPLAGIAFQRKYEELAYQAGQGKIPVQLYGDLKAGRISKGFGDFTPCTKGDWEFANLRTCLPAYIIDSFLEGMRSFGRQIQGYDREDAILAGVETRTSSPVRIERDDSGQSNLRGLFPCGEGAGYAGGITSAAMDGLRMAEALAMTII